MVSINLHNIIKNLKEIKRSYTYMFFVFGCSLLFWYIYLYHKDFELENFILYSFFSAATFDNFIAIFIRLPHKNIPDNYPLWANILIRVILFLFVLFVLVYELNKDNII